MKYLKYFEQASAYEAYKNGSDYVLPNVSYVVENNVVNYTPGSSSSSEYVMVDLGLPSGLLWADRNVGAANPEDNGLYFQWGDKVGYTVEQVTNGEKVFDWSNYFYTTDGGYTFNKYDTDNLVILQPEDDAATVNMGSEYRMPTKEDFEELLNNCTVTYIDLDDNEFSKSEVKSGAIKEHNLKGIKITGSNGSSIFIPASGHYRNDVFERYNSYCYLWSSSLFSDYSPCANYIFFSFFDIPYFSFYNRCFGLNVRGVKAS